MSTPPIQVLVVEDDEVSAQAARTILERLGCQVDAVATGQEAIELFRQKTYDLILMDWQMPVMDGVEATARIRAMPQGRVTPIIGTTANRGRAEVLAAGMNDLIPKPFVREKLKLGLSKWTHWDENQQTQSEL
jgi:two-component system, sensor histidine kinase and response regulator